MNHSGSSRRPSRGDLTSLLLAATLALLLAGCEKPQEKVYRLGYIGPQSEAVAPWIAQAIREQLRDDGFIEGKNLVIDWRWAEGKPERIPGMTADLIALKPDVLFVSGESAYKDVKPLAGAIPIVALLCADPQPQGLVESLAHPGVNLTGASVDCAGSKLRARQLQLLKEIVPSATKVAVLWYAGTAAKNPQMAELEAGARELGLRVYSMPVSGPDDFDAAFAAARPHADVLLLLSDSIVTFYRVRLAQLALQYRLPSVYSGLWAENGGLLDYGGNVPQQNRRAASKVAQIFRGAKPADLPFENPTKFALVINLRTAQALGLKIPQSILVQATQVIE